MVEVVTLQNENEVAGCPAGGELHLDLSKKFYCAIARWEDQIVIAHDTSQRATRGDFFERICYKEIINF